MAETPLPSQYMPVERNDDHPLAWFTLDGKGWIPIDGAASVTIDYEAAINDPLAPKPDSGAPVTYEANRVLRDHSDVCIHGSKMSHNVFSEEEGSNEVVGWCDGGKKVTATEITEMAYSLWQAEQMDDYHREVL